MMGNGEQRQRDDKQGCSTFKVTGRFAFKNVPFNFLYADSVWASMFSFSVSMSP